jgi:hypothetical protein
MCREIYARAAAAAAAAWCAAVLRLSPKGRHKLPAWHARAALHAGAGCLCMFFLLECCCFLQTVNHHA